MFNNNFFGKKQYINFAHFIFTVNIKIFYLFIFIIIHKYLKILFMFRLLIDFSI